MKIQECKSCGSNELVQIENFLVCTFCRSRYVAEIVDIAPGESVIEMRSDVELLLEKCETDPANRRRYINLILDIDPLNQDVKKFM
jgi:hypothetical protein